ncbi:PASTA domain-containing protein [Microbacterium sp. ProA8]|uniref:PASTA domain-containing protein n=1 Tax=Microbacterium chionoecetis TaxID=3153754 RepID=UPI00326646C6
MWEQVGDPVSVPNVVGMPFHLADALAASHGVTLANPDPDGPPIGAIAWRRLVYITSQRPSAGSTVTRHSSVTVEIVQQGDADDMAVQGQPDAPPADAAHVHLERTQVIQLNQEEDRST